MIASFFLAHSSFPIIGNGNSSRFIIFILVFCFLGQTLYENDNYLPRSVFTLVTVEKEWSYENGNGMGPKTLLVRRITWIRNKNLKISVDIRKAIIWIIFERYLRFILLNMDHFQKRIINKKIHFIFLINLFNKGIWHKRLLNMKL